MSKGQRIFLTVAACLAILIGWQMMVPRPPPPPESSDWTAEEPGQSDGSSECTGDPAACFELAKEYLTGEDYDRDKAVGPALELLSQACQREHASACELFVVTYASEDLPPTHRSNPTFAKRACELGEEVGCDYDYHAMGMDPSYSFIILVGFFLLWLLLRALGILGGPLATDLPYANGKRRAVAVVAESIAIAIIIFTAVPVVAGEGNGVTRLALNSIVGFFLVVYPVVTHKLWGKNLGKLVAGITVVDEKGGPLSWRQAWTRSLPDVGLALASAAIYLTTLHGLYDEITTVDFGVQSMRVYRHLPIAYHVIYALSLIWWGSEALVVLYNRRRRAIHDYLAGTAVVVGSKM